MVASAVGYGVQHESLTAQAETTLSGIEQLIDEVQHSTNPYTILEIVPDNQAAEIGYLIPGEEPAISDYDENTGEARFQATIANYKSSDKVNYVIPADVYLVITMNATLTMSASTRSSTLRTLLRAPITANTVKALHSPRTL